MKKNGLWMVLLALVVVIGGALLMYDKLGEKNSGSRLQALSAAGTAPQASSPQIGAASQTTALAHTTPRETETRDPNLQPAPDVTVYDREGKACKLSDFRGKPVVLNFWASWCPPCQAEMPDFEEMYKELGDEVQFLMVNVTDNQRETVKSAAAFIKEKGYTFPVYYDTAQEGARAYQTYSIPRTFFIDAEGFLVANALGGISGAVLQEGINMIR